MSVYSIPFGRPFIDALVEGVIDIARTQKWPLHHATLILPNKRARESVRRAFAQHGEYLPNCISLDELHENPSFLAAVARQFSLPQDVSRMALLLQLIPLINSGSAEEDVRVAQEFLDLYQQSVIQEIDWHNLATLVPDFYAQHWQDILLKLEQFLLTIEKQCQLPERLDAWHYPQWFISRLIDVWQHQPPSYPVIIAGSTGSRPGVVRLMQTVAALENGMVVLPGFSAAHTDQVVVTHPLAVVQETAHKLACPVLEWPYNKVTISESRAAFLLQKIFEDPLTPFSEEACAHLDHLHVAECKDEHEEVQLIAHVLADKVTARAGRHAVITGNEELVRALCLTLGEFNIPFYCSSGVRKIDAPEGLLLWQVVAAAAAQWSLLPTIALLKHSHVCGATTAVEWQQWLVESEKQSWRKFPAPADVFAWCEVNAGASPQSQWFVDACHAWKSVTGAQTVEQWRQQHLAIVQKLAGDDRGFEDLLQPFVAESSNVSVSFQTYATLVKALVLESRSLGSSEAPIHILGAFEGRLQTFDTVFVAGMNYGQWPRKESPNPWLSERLRQELGFDPQEKIIGQSAHDFMQIFASNEVVLTRANREKNEVTTPSPWWERLRLATRDDLWRKIHRQDWLERLRLTRDVRSAIEPLPCPDVSRRPLKLSVTRLELLQSNPYEFFCKKILHLDQVPPLGDRMAPWQQGAEVHSMLERFLRQCPEPPYNKSYFEALLTQLVNKLSNNRLSQFQFQERFIAPLQAVFAELEQSHVAQHYVEVRGQHNFRVGEREFELEARMDRMDLLLDGSVRLIDYKTGQAPTKKDITNFDVLQLLVEAWLYQKGAFAEVMGARNQSAPRVDEISYWQLKGESIRQVSVSGDELRCLLDTIEEHLIALLSRYTDPDFVFSYQDQGRQGYDPFHHLARAAEIN